MRKSFTLFGKKWSITRDQSKTTDGYCDYENNLINIDPTLSGRIKLETLIHEYLHAAFPDKTEKEVSESSLVLSRIIFDEFNLK